MRAVAFLTVLIASTIGLIVDSTPVAAAGQTSVCFSVYAQSSGRQTPGKGLDVAMYYWTSRGWVAAPSGTQRQLDSNGCAIYELRSVPLCSGWNCVAGSARDYSGLYVSFAVNNDRYDGLAQYRSGLTAWVPPGSTSYTVSGTVTCYGLMCQD